MMHPSALLGTPPAHPVVAVCIAKVGSVQTNDAMFVDNASPRDRRGPAKDVSKVTTDVSGTFLGFSMSNIGPDAPPHKRELSVGVAGAFTTHADPADIARMRPGDYLRMDTQSLARIADHAGSFYPPKYTVATGTQHGPLRFLRRETHSTMRVLIAKASRSTGPTYPNKGTKLHAATAFIETPTFTDKLNTYGETATDLADLPAIVTTQMAWRAYMKMRGWGDLEYGPGFLDAEGMRTGVFTMTSKSLHARVPFVLMVDTRNAVRLVSAESVQRGKPTLLAQQLQGKPYDFSATGVRDKYTSESAKVLDQYYAMCDALKDVWKAFITAEVIKNSDLDTDWPATGTYTSWLDDAAYGTFRQAWMTAISTFEAATRPFLVPAETGTFIQTLKSYLSPGKNVSVVSLQPKLTYNATDKNPFDTKAHGNLTEMAVNAANDTTSSIASDNEPQLVQVGANYTNEMQRIDNSPAVQAALTVGSTASRIWGLSAASWSDTDTTPTNVLRGVEAAAGWQLDPGYYPRKTDVGDLPQCETWVNAWAATEYVAATPGLGDDGNYRTIAPQMRGGRERPLGDTRGDGWKATSAMGGAMGNQ